MASTNNPLIRWHASEWTNADLSENVTGPKTEITNQSMVSIHILFTGTPTGEFFVQVSNVYNDVYRGPDPAHASTDWETLPLVDNAGAALSLTASGTAGTYFVNLQNIAASYIRVIYTDTSGSGAANVWITAKS